MVLESLCSFARALSILLQPPFLHAPNDQEVFVGPGAQNGASQFQLEAGTLLQSARRVHRAEDLYQGQAGLSRCKLFVWTPGNPGCLATALPLTPCRAHFLPSPILLQQVLASRQQVVCEPPASQPFRKLIKMGFLSPLPTRTMLRYQVVQRFLYLDLMNPQPLPA